LDAKLRAKGKKRWKRDKETAYFNREAKRKRGKKIDKET
jgi:hypothetical protein